MKRYPKYKDSGVEWIGEIPRHWEMKKIKNTQSDLIGGVWGNEPAENENDIYCIRVADFNYEQLTISTNNLTLRNISLKEKDKRILKNYDLLVEKSGGGEKSPVGKTVIFNAEISRQSVTSNFITKFTAKSDSCFPKYVLYCLCFFYHIGLTRKHIKQTTGIQNLDIDSYFQEKIPLPSLVEQTQIANFLDRKTEQIDELIRIKERQIELLQEQRTALINQAVTKGLDPNVEMKPSSVEWIGEIPSHWNLSMLKYTARLVYGDTLISENRENGIVPVYGSNGIIDTHSSANTLPPAIIVGRKGSLGKVQYSDVPCFVIDTAYYIDSRTSDVNIRWLYYVLQALKLERFRNSVLPGLNRESAEGQYVPLISKEEQVQIVNFLDRKTKQIDELITAEHRKIELLKEYRQSLISEAVTGQNRCPKRCVDDANEMIDNTYHKYISHAFNTSETGIVCIQGDVPSGNA